MKKKKKVSEVKEEDFETFSTWYIFDEWLHLWDMIVALRNNKFLILVVYWVFFLKMKLLKVDFEKYIYMNGLCVVKKDVKFRSMLIDWN